IFSSYKVAVVDCSRYLQGKRENPDSLLAKIRNLIISHPFAPENMHSRIRGNQVVLMYFSEYSKEEEDSFFRNISSTLEGGGHSNLLCTGIGKPTKNWQEFKDSYYQAIIALEIGQSILSDLRIVRYEDLGLYRLLCQIKNRRVLRDYVEESVLPLFEYDARCKSDLCETLRIFLEKGSQQETADTLVIHRQTLIYRLRKISEILQKDLSDPKIRMELYVGLLILDIADMKPLG
nr:helix-turn-helix domain-containing protein [Synergistaceae bacterium]